MNGAGPEIFEPRAIRGRMIAAADVQAVSVKIPRSDLRRIPEANRSEFIRSAVSEKLARQPACEWKPKTATGRKLLALREKFIRSGGELLDSEGIANELKQRRGGLA